MIEFLKGIYNAIMFFLPFKGEKKEEEKFEISDFSHFNRYGLEAIINKKPRKDDKKRDKNKYVNQLMDLIFKARSINNKPSKSSEDINRYEEIIEECLKLKRDFNS